MSTSNGKGVGRTRTTWSTNQKTGKTRMTQSTKVGPNSWYVSSKLDKLRKIRIPKAKSKPVDQYYAFGYLLGLIIVGFLMFFG